MKYIASLAAIAVLSACSQAETTPEPEATDEMAAPAAEALAADGQPSPGMYKVTTSDGTVLMEDANADGTYVQTNEAGEVVETGTWDQPSPDQFCYAVDEDYVNEDNTSERVCNTEIVGEDGVWTSTSPDGEVATIERAAG